MAEVDLGSITRNEIVMVFKPEAPKPGATSQQGDGDSITKSELQVDLWFNFKRQSQIEKEDLFRIKDFWDRKIQVQLKLYDATPGGSELIHFQILVTAVDAKTPAIK